MYINDMQDFRKLRVYELANQMTVAAYEVAESLPVAERYGLARQMKRAGVSVVSNIAEGAGRGGPDFDDS